jgi:DNA-binding NarL/FixJ family response regulator
VWYGEALANELLLMLPIAIAAKSCGRQGNAMLTLNQIKITPRDQQVLQLLMQGCSNKDITAQLNISPRTVKQHPFAKEQMKSCNP